MFDIEMSGPKVFRKNDYRDMQLTQITSKNEIDELCTLEVHQESSVIPLYDIVDWEQITIV